MEEIRCNALKKKGPSVIQLAKAEGRENLFLDTENIGRESKEAGNRWHNGSRHRSEDGWREGSFVKGRCEGGVRSTTRWEIRVPRTPC